MLYIRTHMILEISASFLPCAQIMAVQRRLLVLSVPSKNSFLQLMYHHPVFACRIIFSAQEESTVEKKLQEWSTTIYKPSATKHKKCFPLHARSCALGFLSCVIFHPMIFKSDVHVTFNFF